MHWCPIIVIVTDANNLPIIGHHTLYNRRNQPSNVSQGDTVNEDSSFYSAIRFYGLEGVLSSIGGDGVLVVPRKLQPITTILDTFI